MKGNGKDFFYRFCLKTQIDQQDKTSQNNANLTKSNDNQMPAIYTAFL